MSYVFCLAPEEYLADFFFSFYMQLLKTLFEIVLFEDCGNQWSLSRPMLSLILLSEQVTDCAFELHVFHLLYYCFSACQLAGVSLCIFSEDR